jgi:beta-mannosidase
MEDTNGDARGDTHLWRVWHGLKPFPYFRSRPTRFASEFGLEALPALDTIATFARPEEHDLRSSVLLHHQRSAGGNDKMVYYLTDRFRLPRDFADMVYLTQIVQAEAIRIGVEHWRRNRPRCAGALYWQLNDCWPVVSWASIDYDGRWKALQYAACRFFAPVALSLEDDGSRVGVYVANDTPAPWQGQVRWSLETLAGEGVESGQEAVAAAPMAATRVRAFNFAPQLGQHGRSSLVFVAELWQGEARQAGQRLACQVVTFAPERQMVLPDPGLTAQVQARDGVLEITVSTRALARFVALSLLGADVVWSDNYFDLPAGRTARVTCPNQAGWSLEQARQALRVRSLADVQPAGSPLSDRIHHHRAGLRPASLLTRVLFAFMK